MRLTGIFCVLFLVVHAAASASAAPTSAARSVSGSLAEPSPAPTLPVPRLRVTGAKVVLEVARPDPLGRSGRERVDGPMEAVWAMLEAFADRSETAYAGWMSDDFRFDSDDPDFRASTPNGMDRAAEEQFARHLFRGGKLSPDGRALPTATRVQLSAGPVLATAVAMPHDQAHVTLAHLEVSIALSDGSTLELGETRNELWLVRTPAGWRVRRWQETHPAPDALDAVAQRLAHAVNARDTLAPSTAAQEPPAPVATERVALAPHMDRERAALVFDVTLPAAGGSLEVFDVMGRRVIRRDLSDLGAGHHVVALDGHELGVGVYWARIQQGVNVATARVVWIR